MPSMFTLPWYWTTAERPDSVLVFASRFDATGLEARWVLFSAGIRLWRAVRSSPGALGASLLAQPLVGRFYTVSLWRGEDDLLAFARGEAHRSAVEVIAQLGVSGVLVSRPSDGSRPRWRDITSWLRGAEVGPYRHEASPTPV